MDWNQIADSWKLLLTKVASATGAAAEVDSQLNDTFPASPYPGDEYDDGKISPYTPDNHIERIESSLHMSC